MNLDSPVTEICGVGERRAKGLFRMGIFTAGDLISHFPREYDDRSQVKKIKDLVIDKENTFRGKVMGKGENIRIRNITFTRLKISDETGSVNGVWYNQPYMKTALKEQAEYIFTGKLQKKFGKLEVLSPEYEKVEEGNLSGHIVPIYPLVAGISQKLIRGLIREALNQTETQLYEILPSWMRKRYCLCQRNFAMENIHFPKDKNSFLQARRRLVFEEFFLLQTALLRMKAVLQEGKNGMIFEQEESCQRLLEQFPFSLTNAQKKVFEEIKQDIRSGKVMNRLVQGDVGSGKTAVAMLGAYWAIQNGYQAALMAPTEVLAEQHLLSFQDLFEPLGIKTVLLSGSLKAKEKRRALEEIGSGEAQMILGTHAIIQEAVVFHKLGLVIADEQHRFGVRQRGTFAEKGDNPHVLVMTATPIPRTLALILYGDLDISIMDELPPGRQKIDTMAVPPTYRERIYGFIKKQVDDGRQAYIICPMIEESEKLEAKAVISYTEKMQEGGFKDYVVASVHGKMKPKEKQEVMERFVSGEIQVLVATTVIEVGINVPNAVIMLIENAERFGLAQLHQLRGRVGRGTVKSYCILVSESKTKIAKERLKAMEKSSDGFVLSEMDLKLRGPGEFFGTRQHGLPELKIANLYQDMDLLKEAQEAAAFLLENDTEFRKEEHVLLKEMMDKLLKEERLNI